MGGLKMKIHLPLLCNIWSPVQYYNKFIGQNISLFEQMPVHTFSKQFWRKDPMNIAEKGSRLFNSADCDYFNTKRKALSVVYILNEFRRCIEGSEIIIASDHQTLRWLISLKSPSGRLA